MKLNLTDGYVINPYIIWGELDYRGYASIGLQPKEDFKDLKFLNDIQSRCQYIKTNGIDYLFMSCPLSECSPNQSVFNLNDRRLSNFYRRTYENAQEEIFRSFYRIKNLCGQEINQLDNQDLSYLWSGYFNPLDFPHDLDYFNPSKSILANCLPECHLKENTTGFELNGCIHHFIQVKSFSSISELTKVLNDRTFTVTMNESGCEILIHLYSKNLKEINQQAKEVKKLLHSLKQTDYYEANNAKENISFFERSVPGWCYGCGESASAEALPA